MNKHTISVHAGQCRDRNRGVVNPIDPSSAFQYVDGGDQFYPRYFNTPNQSIVVEKIARLENAESGVLFSSGMAAISTTMMTLLHRGDHAVLLSGLYGGTHSFVIKEFDEAGIEYSFAAGSVDELMAATRENTKLIFVESPTNPMLQVIDLQPLSDQARREGIVTVIDNTFASPINQNPVDLGFDVVIHSGTKYLGGHSDLCFGVVVGQGEIIESIRRKAINFGGSVNALTCYLIERSIKTLAVRVEKQNENAMKIAHFLNRHASVDEVFYPGLEDQAGHATAERQMRGFGGMLSFQLGGSKPIQDFVNQLELITPAMSLGGVESTLTIPIFTSHRLMPVEARKRLGIGDRLARLSVGIESADDLIADIQSALQTITSEKPTAV